MNYQEIQIMINKYFDGELQKGTEPLLFTQLSLNEDAREYFKSMNIIQETIKNDEKKFPLQLEEQIMHSIQDTMSKSNKLQFWKNPSTIISYGFATLLLIFSIFFYTQSFEYQRKLEHTMIQVSQQSQMISLLMNNSLPMARVEYEIKNQIIVEHETEKPKKLEQTIL